MSGARRLELKAAASTCDAYRFADRISPVDSIGKGPSNSKGVDMAEKMSGGEQQTCG